MKDIFYSEQEDILFQVIGYSAADNVSKLGEKIKSLQEGGQNFAKACGHDWEDVSTFQVLKSSRYKYMRVYWVSQPKTIPDEAFRFGKDWTMNKWLQN